MHLRLRVLPVVLALALPGCGESDIPEADPTLTPSSLPAPGAAIDSTQAQVFDREFLFVSTSADSTIHIPWFFRARVYAEGIRREIGTWIGRSGTWEVLASEQVDVPVSRTPWQILPGEHVRLLVGEGDRIDAIWLRDPAHATETRVEDFLIEWSRPGSELVRLFEGRTLFPSTEVDGFVLEVNRRWEAPGQAPGDWIFLHAGTQLQLFMEETAPLGTPRSPASFRGWSRLAFQSAQWNGLEVTWEALRPFEPARRDIPGVWVISGAGGLVTGRLESVGSHLAAGVGDGPILPLAGFFSVQGEVSVRGESFAVTGVLRHVQH